MSEDFPNGTSDAKVTRRGDLVPGDGQDEANDGQTSTISWTDPNTVGWADALQHLMLRLGDDVGRVGSLDARPTSPTSSDPVWWLATDAGPNNRPVLYRNDDVAGAWVPVGSYLPGADMVVADGAVQLGDGSTETFSESTSPTSWEFTPSEDIHQQTALDITNGSTASVTEDVTVDLYEGVDTTGTLLLSETRSITVAASTTVTETFIVTDESLAETAHHIEVTTSGTTLSIDNAVETVDEQDWRWDRLADGTLQVTDARTATAVMEIDPLTGNTDLAGNEIRTVAGIWSDSAGGGQLRFDGAADAAFQTSGSGTGNNVIYDLANNQPIAKFHEGGLVEIPNGDLTDGVTTIWDATNDHVPAASVEQGAGSGLDADTRDGLEGYQELQQSPNDGIKFSDIPAGDYVAQSVYIPAGQTLTVYMWGARTDGQTTPAGLTVELFDETGAVSVASESTPRNTGNPVVAGTTDVTLSAGATAAVDATLRLNNGTAGALTAGAQFGYDIS